MYNLALIILHLEQNNGVRVGPHQLRHDCVFYFRYSSFVRCVSVMREQRQTNREDARKERKRYQPGLHKTPIVELLLPSALLVLVLRFLVYVLPEIRVLVRGADVFYPDVVGI